MKRLRGSHICIHSWIQNPANFFFFGTFSFVSLLRLSWVSFFFLQSAFSLPSPEPLYNNLSQIAISWIKTWNWSSMPLTGTRDYSPSRAFTVEYLCETGWKDQRFLFHCFQSTNSMYPSILFFPTYDLDWVSWHVFRFVISSMHKWT